MLTIFAIGWILILILTVFSIYTLMNEGGGFFDWFLLVVGIAAAFILSATVSVDTGIEVQGTGGFLAFTTPFYLLIISVLSFYFRRKLCYSSDDGCFGGFRVIIEITGFISSILGIISFFSK